MTCGMREFLHPEGEFSPPSAGRLRCRVKDRVFWGGMYRQTGFLPYSSFNGCGVIITMTHIEVLCVQGRSQTRDSKHKARHMEID